MTLRLALLAAAFACFAARAPAQMPAADANDTDDVLRGVVIDSITRQPVGRVLVFSPDNRFAALTDDGGRFQFTFARKSEAPPEPGRPVPPNRPNELFVRKPGFLSERDQQQFPIAPTQHDITITIVPEALIIGRVNLPSGNSDSITFEIFRRQISEGRERWQSVASVGSRSSGDFRFANLAAGSYKLVSHELPDRDPLTSDPGAEFGYPPVYFPAASDFSSAAIIQLAPGQTFQASITPVRRQYFPVKVKVANAPATVFPMVLVAPQGHPGPGYSLGYNPDDDLVEGFLPEGVYTVRLATYGPDVTSGQLNIAVGPGTMSVPTLVMTRNPPITVRVKNEFQQSYGFGQSEELSGLSPGVLVPLSPAQSYARHLQLQLVPDEDFAVDQSFAAHPPNDPQADFLVIDNVQPSRYRVRAESTVGFIASITSGDTDLLHNPLIVPPGASIPPIEVTLRDDGAEVRGEVQLGSSTFSAPSTSGIWVSGALRRTFVTNSPGCVYFLPTSDRGGQFRQIWINSDGKFDAQQLPPGEYRVLAFSVQHPDLEFADADALRKFDSQAQVISLSPGQKESVRLPLITAEERP